MKINYHFRPDDFFAEMAKTDEHMQKVRKNLMAKQAAQSRVEKVRQLRDQKKIAKRVQVNNYNFKIVNCAISHGVLRYLDLLYNTWPINIINFQIDTKLKQATDKKQMLEQLKRVRKGKSTDLDFLEDNKGKGNKGNNAKNKVNKKRALKDQKFGFGGKKKGSKLNTRESSSQMDGYNSSAKKKPLNFKSKQFKPNNKKKNQRPGKSKRKNAK